MKFYEESNFDRARYEDLLNRIEHDDRDATNYEEMLKFLFPYLLRNEQFEDRENLFAQYKHFNQDQCDKCYIHIPHDIPYLGIAYARQSIADLLSGDLGHGLMQLKKIGNKALGDEDHEGKKVMHNGETFYPTNRHFLVYNYVKVLKRLGETKALDWMHEYFHEALTRTGDEEHDTLMTHQVVVRKHVVYYPTFYQVCQMEGRKNDFYLYYRTLDCVTIDRVFRTYPDKEKIEESLHTFFKNEEYDD
ncbi:MAG: hypothetical protein U0K57_00950 [Lachnospiraceae bacterium]|nr:hypothetical protein [Lachnospiraceae bacterium]